MTSKSTLLKNTTTLVALFFLFAINVNAQKISLGIRAGGIYSTLNGLDSSVYKPGVMGGLFLEYKGESAWSFTADFLYAQKGTTFDRSSKNANNTVREKYTNDYKMNYFELPILFHYNFLSDSSKFRPRIFAGPSINIRLKSTNSFNYTKTSLTNDSTLANLDGSEDLAFKYSPIDYGAVVGVGFTFAATDKLNIYFDARYSFGLLDIREKISNSSKAIHNRNAMVMIGVSYSLSK
jgi:outer membrane protein W